MATAYQRRLIQLPSRAGGYGGGSDYASPAGPKLASLAGILEQQKRTLKLLGGNPPKQVIGGAGRVFDLLSRLQYAPANMVQQGLRTAYGIDETGRKGERGSLGESYKAMGTGFLRGLAGKDKTSLRDVIKTESQIFPGNPVLKNRVFQAVAGLGGDILIDPTTYASFGVAPALKTFDKTAQALKTIDEVADASRMAANVGRAARVGEEAAGGARAIGGYRALKTGAKTEAFRDIAGETVKQMGDIPGSVTMKFAGKNVPLGPVGRGLYTAGVGAKAGATKFIPAEDLAKLMSLGHNLVGDTKASFREANARNAYYIAEKEKNVKKFLKNLTPDDQEAYKAWRQSKRPGILNPPVVGVAKDGRPLQEYFDTLDQFQGVLDDIEKISGRARATHRVDNDIPAFFSNEEYGSKAWKKWMADNEKHIDETGFSYSLSDISRMQGLHPEQDLETILLKRIRQAHGVAAKAQFKSDVLKQYGRQFTGEGSHAAEQAAQDMGAELVEDRLLRNTQMAGQRWFVDPDIHKAMKYAQDMYDNPNIARGFWDFFDRTQRSWKSLVTTYSPGHHVRNLFGDAFLNFVSGNQNPFNYVEGNRIRTRAAGSMKLGGKNVSYDTLRNKLIEHGGLSGFTRTELRDPMRLIQEGEGRIETALRKKASQTGEKLSDAAERARGAREWIYEKADVREEFGRNSNYVYHLKKYAEEHPKLDFADPKVIDDATKYAARKMRDSMLDYGNLTNFERQVMQRTFPFYNFTRQATPQMAKMLLMHPDMMSRIPKGMNSLSVLLGADPNSASMTEIVPDYIKDALGVRAQDEGGQSLLGRLLNTANPLQLDLSNTIPAIEAFNLLNGAIPGTGESFGKDFLLKQVANRFGPAPKTFVQSAFGKSTLTGQDINKPFPQMAADVVTPTMLKRLPGTLRGIPQIGGAFGLGEQDPEKIKSQRIALLNLLAPARIQELTPNVQASELRRQQDPIETRIRIEREKLLELLQKQQQRYIRRR